MIINNNINALNTHRQMTTNNASMSKNMERLSSGLRINSASDDAAGLAISEKMRGQIRGLEMAQKNSQDAISLMQTAEGALNETHSILQRMRELAVQSANDTNNDTDRQKLQDEMNQLTEEIDSIAKNTAFNGSKVLDGTFANKTFQTGANEGQSLSLSIESMSAVSLNTKTATISAVESGTFTEAETTTPSRLAAGTYTVADNGTDLLDQTGSVVGSVATNTVTTSGDADTYAFTSNLVAGTSITIDAANASSAQFPPADVSVTSSFDNLAVGAYTTTDGTNVLKDGEAFGTVTDFTAEYGVTLNVGESFEIKGADISDAEAAATAISTIDTAIESVSAERSKLGAVQNRLDHTINNLGATAENLSAAESRIRDVDMAKEIMEQTKNSILSQAAQAMLAQANQQPQAVLQLLR